MKDITDIHKVFADHIGTDRNLKAAAYAVSKKLEDGHICVDIKDYNEEIRRADDSKYAERNPFLSDGETITTESLLANPLVSQESGNVQPFIYKNGRLYLQRYFQYESDIIDGIRSPGNQPDPYFSAIKNKQLNELKNLVTGLFTPTTDVVQNETDWQLVAAIRAITNNFLIITGGPGTGKTTTVAKILAILFTMQPGLKVALAAPTGKAASRLNESLAVAKEDLSGINKEIKDKFDRINASTIHRLLGSKFNTPYFKHNKENPLDFDVVIIDESSMIAASIMAKLIVALAPNSRLILLGDKDQLASVEAGSIFGDLCLTQSNQMNFLETPTIRFINGFITGPASKIPVQFELSQSINLLSEKIIELKKSYRFKDDEGIGKFSKGVITGNLDDLSSFKSKTGEGVTIVNEFDFEQLSNNREFIEEIDRFADYIREQDIQKALRLINNIRVLCAVNEGNFGINNFNNLIGNYLKKKGLINPSFTFYHNQPIIVTRNDYSLGLYNGDVGIIRSDAEGVLKAYFESVDEKGNPDLKEVLPGFIAEFKTVFAMTIHKSQGSEFEHVVIILPDKDHVPILTRELLYTGVTRAKKHTLIIAQDDIIMKAVEKKVSRASGIRQRIENLKY